MLFPEYTTILCFNPCFNGRCKRTAKAKTATCRKHAVSILVLMEDVKELGMQQKIIEDSLCFNPCFNGRCKRTTDT